MTAVSREQLLAFRVARHGLAGERELALVDAAACPASDFQPGSALLALGARSAEVTPEAFDAAIESRELVAGLNLRGAVHVIAGEDWSLFGRSLIAESEDELREQLGNQAKREADATGIPVAETLEEVAGATTEALKGGRSLTKDELHEELRARVRDELLPWCKGCKSHHVAPMVWRYAAIKAGMRRDSSRRYVRGRPPAKADPADAARRFLSFYGPAKPADFVAWAGTARSQGRRIWDAVEPELAEVVLEGKKSWLLAADQATLESPPQASGLRLLPPHDPLLQHPNRATIAPDAAIRKRMFRPVASPGVVLTDGHSAGLWKARAKGKVASFEVEAFGPIDRDLLDSEAGRVAGLRGQETAQVTVAAVRS